MSDFVASNNDCSVWSFHCPDDSTGEHRIGMASGVGTEEGDAIRQLAKEKHALGIGYSPGILGGKGGWVMTFVEGRSQWWSRGERLSAEAPA